MNFMLNERQNYIHMIAPQYQKASKKDKSLMLDHGTRVLAMNRSYLAHCLSLSHRVIRLSGKVKLQGDVRKKSVRKRSCFFTPATIAWLIYFWKVMYQCCDQRLHSMIPLLMAKRAQFETLHEDAWKAQDLPPWTQEIENQLRSMSASSIYRYLRKERQKARFKGISHTRPGSLLKQNIEVKTFAMWDKDIPGFTQMDLVGHEGGDARGCFAFSLNITDVATQWTETVATPTKAQSFVFAALQQGKARFPLALKGLHSDNGSEFINAHLWKYCMQEQLQFTRNRKSFKNDSCYIEQKNWSLVRSYVGYARYDTLAEVQCMNALYEVLRLYTHYFLPVMQLQEKLRIGARMMKRWDRPKTPYQRVMESSHVPVENKQACQAVYETLDPFTLNQEVQRLKNKLKGLRRKKELDRIHAEDKLLNKDSAGKVLAESSKTVRIGF